MKGIYFILFTFFAIQLSYAQKADRIVKKPLLRYENSYGISFNSDGWGGGYRYGKAKTYRNKKVWDFSFYFVRDTKQYRYYNQYDNSAKSFFFGKQIHFYSFQILRGREKILTEKPYWGGVEIRYFYFGGLNLGIGKPIYMYIVDFMNGGVLTLEKYDVQKHDLENIWGRGPFSKGLSEIEFHPGLSWKMGLNIEFGPYQEKTKALEAGLIIDAYVLPVQIMGFDDPKYAMFRLFLAYRFGKRYNSNK